MNKQIDWDKWLNSYLSKYEKNRFGLEEPEPTELQVNIPTHDHKQWLNDFIQEIERLETFDSIRLICRNCGEKINDDKYLFLPHPDDPNDISKTLYFHSKGSCDPRINNIQTARENWLNNRLSKDSNRKV